MDNAYTQPAAGAGERMVRRAADPGSATATDLSALLAALYAQEAHLQDIGHTLKDLGAQVEDARRALAEHLAR